MTERATLAQRASDVGAFFDLEAARYDGAYDGVGAGTHTLNARMAAALEILGDGPGDVLDIGMGPGRLCQQLAARGWTVWGVDPSAQMVARARARVPQAASRLQEGCAEALVFADASFDAVAGTGVLEYAGDLAAVLAEVARVLRPGGWAALSIPNPRAPYALVKRAGIYPIAGLAARAGCARRPARPRGGRPVGRGEFERHLAGAGLRAHAAHHTSRLVVPPPLDAHFPRTAARMAAFLERSDSLAARRLSTQLVFAVERVPR